MSLPFWFLVFLTMPHRTWPCHAEPCHDTTNRFYSFHALPHLRNLVSVPCLALPSRTLPGRATPSLKIFLPCRTRTRAALPKLAWPRLATRYSCHVTFAKLIVSSILVCRAATRRASRDHTKPRAAAPQQIKIDFRALPCRSAPYQARTHLATPNPAG
jgi:hypothetical protein